MPGIVVQMTSCSKSAGHSLQLMAQSHLTPFLGGPLFRFQLFHYSPAIPIPDKKTLLNWKGQPSVEPLTPPKCLSLKIGDFMNGRKSVQSNVTVLLCCGM